MSIALSALILLARSLPPIAAPPHLLRKWRLLVNSDRARYLGRCDGDRPRDEEVPGITGHRSAGVRLNWRR